MLHENVVNSLTKLSTHSSVTYKMLTVTVSELFLNLTVRKDIIWRAQGAVQDAAAGEIRTECISVRARAYIGSAVDEVISLCYCYRGV